MARSNQGGTRGFIRGKVANDLYQVTRNKDGKRIQLVRAVEESRTNNNTIDQACARMRMALLMGALSDLKQIVDHSWEGIPYGQLSIANFVRVNMPELIRDQVEHWNGENRYYYPDKGIQAIRMGAFYIAGGTLATPSFITRGAGYGFGQWYPFTINLGMAFPTYRDLKRALGFNADDYITLLMMSAISTGSGMDYQRLLFARLYLEKGISDIMVLSTENIATCFRLEGNTTCRMSVVQQTGVIRFELDNQPDGNPRDTELSAVILSRWTGKVWARNNAQLAQSDGLDFPSFEEGAPRWHFKSWYPSYDPDADESDVYPGKNPLE